MNNYQPKVGEKCIAKSKVGGEREEIVPKYIGEIWLIAVRKGVYLTGSYTFEPIKTDEEKAIDKLARLMQMVNQDFGVTYEEWANHIIKAGYHNGPKVKPLDISRLNDFFVLMRDETGYSASRMFHWLTQNGYAVGEPND